MNKLIKKIYKFLYNPRNERFIILGMPCISVFIACMILIPSLKVISGVEEHESDFISFSDSESNDYTAPGNDYTNTDIIQENEHGNELTQVEDDIVIDNEKQDVYLTASSTERDLYIFTHKPDGETIRDKQFSYSVLFPDGNTYIYGTDEDGGCYLVNLSPGEYTVTLNEGEGCVALSSVTCSVKDKVQYEIIEDINDKVDVTSDVSIQHEVKTISYTGADEMTPEEISTSTETGEGDNMINSYPVLDENGNQTYTYTFETGENGYLLYSDGSESNIIPNVEEIHGSEQLVCGLVYDEENNVYNSVELFRSDNTPFEEFLINAEPVIRELVSETGWQSVNGKIFYFYPDGSKAVGLKKIDGKIFYFNERGEKATELGIDVSFYNGAINWPAVKNGGVDFVIIRVGGRGWSSGMLYDDSCFFSYLQGARAAGLKVGVYFYSTAVNAREAVEEASLVLDRLGSIRLDYPIFIDMEFSGDYPDGRADTLPSSLHAEIAQAFCETVKNYGYSAGVYSSSSYFYYCTNYASISQYTIWLANYTSDNKLPAFPYRYDIWQFTDRGNVSGISGIVDMNAIY